MTNPFFNARVIGADIDPADYHRKQFERGDPRFVMTRSELMTFAQCPARWLKGYRREDSDATKWGSLIDCRVLTPGRFHDLYAERPAERSGGKKWNGNATECREWREEQEAVGKTVLTPQERGMSDLALGILFADELIKSFIQRSDKQVLVTGEYRDDATGITVQIKTLIDLVPHAECFFEDAAGDFKTARNGSPQAWQYVVDACDYDAQAAIGLWMLQAAGKTERKNWYFLGQENVSPWQTFRRKLSAEYIDLGQQKVINALGRYCLCLKTDRWPDWDSEGDGWTVTEPPMKAINKMLFAPSAPIPDPDWMRDDKPETTT